MLSVLLVEKRCTSPRLRVGFAENAFQLEISSVFHEDDVRIMWNWYVRLLCFGLSSRPIDVARGAFHDDARVLSAVDGVVFIIGENA